MVQLRSVAVVMALMLVCGCCCPPRGRACCPPPSSAPDVIPRPVEVVIEEPEDDRAGDDRADDAATTDLRVQLSKKRVKGLQWEEVSLDDAFTYLRTITGLVFVISTEAREAAGADVAITLQLDDVPLDTVLDLIVEMTGLRWEARDGGIWIVARDEK